MRLITGVLLSYELFNGQVVSNDYLPFYLFR